jgi:probable aminopeptidase NPEPL1
MSATTEVLFCQDAAASAPPGNNKKKTLLLGKRSVVSQLDIAKTTGLAISSTVLSSLLESIPSAGGIASTFFVATETEGGEGAAGPQQLYCALLPDKVSRHNHPYSVHSITDHIVKVKPTNIIFAAHDMNRSLVDAVTAAAAKAFPLYSRKTKKMSSTNNNGGGKDQSSTCLQISFTDELGHLYQDYNAAHATALYEGVQLAGRFMDMPPAELTTTVFAQQVHDLFSNEKSVTIREIVGPELEEQGYGGLYHVGKAAMEPPRLVICEYQPPVTSTTTTRNTTTTTTVALVGKGIVYDTGGLALKSREGMCGMKHDMGGAAGLLGAFYTLVKRQVPNTDITLLLCLAENAIGPNAFRNDDILTLYSGKTIEINNSDAEGRIVLGDGVAHATKHIANLDLVVNMATLTGAQLITTGKKHAGILATSPALEQKAVTAGLASGDLVYPMLYCPELLVSEFDSKIADMKNSVKDRSNAQASCAGHFIEAQLDDHYTGEWLHIDMAGPGSKDDRGTGYGVALVTALLEGMTMPITAAATGTKE